MTSLLYKYCGAIRILCITVIPPLPPSLPPLAPISLPSLPPFPSLPLVTQRIHCPFQSKQSPSYMKFSANLVYILFFRNVNFFPRYWVCHLHMHIQTLKQVYANELYICQTQRKSNAHIVMIFDMLCRNLNNDICSIDSK